MKAFKKTGKIIALASMASMLTIGAAMADPIAIQGRVLPAADQGYELLAGNGQSYKLEGRDNELSTMIPNVVMVWGDLSGKTIRIDTLANLGY